MPSPSIYIKNVHNKESSQLKVVVGVPSKVTHSKSFLNQIYDDPMKANEQKITIGSCAIPISQLDV